jgi:UDP-glucuronate decarboxylase
MMKLMNSDKDITGPINVGNPNEFTMLELANKIIEATKSSSQLIFKDLPSDDPKQRKPDISKASKLLSWEPEIELSEGLAKTIRYFRPIIEG